MARLGWGIVGPGNIVQGTMAPAMVAEPDSELVAVAGRDIGRARNVATRFGADRAYDDYDEMLTDPAVDAVFIATPNALHADQVVAAAAAGKHVLCDKPLAISGADAARAVAACDAAGVLLGVNFHNRQLPWVRDVADLVASGRLGDVDYVDVQVAAGRRQPSGWRADPELAGLGTVHNVGVHALDFLRVILHAEATEVSAWFDEPPGSGVVETMALIRLRFDNGVAASVDANEKLANPRNDITIYGSEGRIVGSGITRSRIAGDLSVLTDGSEETTHYPAVDAHRLTLAAFTEAVLTGSTPDPSGLDGLRSALLCDVIGRSARDGGTVTVAQPVV